MEEKTKLPLIHVNLRALHDILDATVQPLIEEKIEDLTSILHKTPTGYLFELHAKGEEFVLETFTDERRTPFKLIVEVDDALHYIARHGLETFIDTAKDKVEEGIHQMYLQNNPVEDDPSEEKTSQ